VFIENITMIRYTNPIIEKILAIRKLLTSYAGIIAPIIIDMAEIENGKII
jgi:hypothetical protein